MQPKPPIIIGQNWPLYFARPSSVPSLDIWSLYKRTEAGDMFLGTLASREAAVEVTTQLNQAKERPRAIFLPVTLFGTASIN